MNTFVNTLTHLGLAALAVALSALATNATSIDPQWGGVIAGLASAGLALVNDYLGKPAQQVVAQALGKEYEEPTQ